MYTAPFILPKSSQSALEPALRLFLLDSGVFLGYLYAMNDDEDLTVFQTDEDKQILEKRILEELDEDITNIEFLENDR